jgi:hypothetical protein
VQIAIQCRFLKGRVNHNGNCTGKANMLAQANGFAPNNTVFHISKGKRLSMEIIKQLFDVASFLM